MVTRRADTPAQTLGRSWPRCRRQQRLTRPVRPLAGLLGLVLVLACILPTQALAARWAALCSQGALCTITGTAVAGEPASLRLQWRGRVAWDERPREARIGSDGGVVRAGGEAVHAVDGRLAATVAAAGEQATAFEIRETLLLPAAVTAALGDAGGRLQYERTFDLDGVPRTASIPLTVAPARADPAPDHGSEGSGEPAGPRATGVEIERLELRFVDGQPLMWVEPEAEVRAILRARHEGSGLFAGQWEVAYPETVIAEPVFVPIARVQSYLRPGRQQEWRSPRLPSTASGPYRVRFRLLQPAAVEPLTIEYIVGAARAPHRVIAPLALLQPQAHAQWGAETVFGWEPAAGAHAYRLEFYAGSVLDREEGSPATAGDSVPAPGSDRSGARVLGGELVPGGVHDLRPSAVARRQLEPGRRYAWRVVAIAADGRLVAVSPLRPIRVPPAAAGSADGG